MSGSQQWIVDRFAPKLVDAERRLDNVRRTVDTFSGLGIEPTHSTTENQKLMKMNTELSQKCQGINQEGVLKSEGESSMMKTECVKLGKPESYAEALRRPPPQKTEEELRSSRFTILTWDQYRSNTKI